jgi:hypothetical protein
MRGKLETLQEFWEWVKEQLTPKETNNKLLLGTDNEVSTACLLVAEQGELHTLQKFWEWAKEKLTTQEVNNKLY